MDVASSEMSLITEILGDLGHSLSLNCLEVDSGIKSSSKISLNNTSVIHLPLFSLAMVNRQTDETA
jgi:hypothetical protein